VNAADWIAIGIGGLVLWLSRDRGAGAPAPTGGPMYTVLQQWMRNAKGNVVFRRGVPVLNIQAMRRRAIAGAHLRMASPGISL